MDYGRKDAKKMFKEALSGILIVPLPRWVFRFVSGVAYRKTLLSSGRKTESHRHIFFSFYMAEKIKSLEQPDNSEIPLPEYSVVIVLPFVHHAWTNVNGAWKDSHIYDLTPFHKPHLFA